jgi:hypothetical protein
VKIKQGIYNAEKHLHDQDRYLETFARNDRKLQQEISRPL